MRERNGLSGRDLVLRFALQLLRGYRWFPFVMGCAFVWGSFLLLRVSAIDTPLITHSIFLNVYTHKRNVTNKIQQTRKRDEIGQEIKQNVHSMSGVSGRDDRFCLLYFSIVTCMYILQRFVQM